jgi:hypothetical protein
MVNAVSLFKLHHKLLKSTEQSVTWLSDVKSIMAN